VKLREFDAQQIFAVGDQAQSPYGDVEKTVVHWRVLLHWLSRGGNSNNGTNWASCGIIRHLNMSHAGPPLLQAAQCGFFNWRSF
jgi:hypothetical protein